MDIYSSTTGLPAVIVDNLPVVLSAAAYRSSAALTRPANTTAYAAGDVVGGVLTFPAAGKLGTNVLLTTADMQVHTASLPSGMLGFRLYLYNVAPPSAYADNALWDLPSTDRAGFLGYLEFATPVDMGSTLYVQSDVINKQLALESSSLFGYLVTLGAFTPAANSEVYVPSIYTVGL